MIPLAVRPLAHCASASMFSLKKGRARARSQLVDKGISLPKKNTILNASGKSRLQTLTLTEPFPAFCGNSNGELAEI